MEDESNVPSKLVAVLGVNVEVSGLLFWCWKPSSKPTNSHIQECGSEVGLT